MMRSSLTTLITFSATLPLVSSVIVATKYGKLEGLVASYPNASGPFQTINMFLGVPFAAPPIGELRFKAPLPPKQWKPDVRSAKENGNVCWQQKGSLNLTYSEDCLNLDVYTPNVRSSLPVLVYIHGGGFESGSAAVYPSDMLALHGVVVVVIQYRLGAFGFLTTGDSAAPGNLGMLDQVEALKWVKENIEIFGGNPGKVTIFGVSSGGVSVSLHLLSPLSKDLFHQAIIESGVDLSPQAIQPTSFGLHYAKDLALKLNCPTGYHGQMVACISDKRPAEIIKASKAANFEIMDHTQWGPVVDKNFLHDTPQNLRKKGEFKKAPLIICFTSNEDSAGVGIFANMSYIGLMKSVDNGVSKDFFKTFLAKYSQAHHSRKEIADDITNALQFMYTPRPDSSDKYGLRSQLVNFLGDRYHFAPSHKVADTHSLFAPVYMYVFAHSSVYSRYPDWWGATHGSNIPYNFGGPVSAGWPLPRSDADVNVTLFVMTTYANFARSGDPTPQPVSGVTWERYNPSHKAYLRVDTDPKMMPAFYPFRMAFWNDYYPQLAEVKLEEVDCPRSTGSTMGTLWQIIFVFLSYAFVVM